MKTKVCTKCKQEKPLNEFYKHRGTKDGLDLWCSTCSNANSKRWAKTPSGIYTRIKSRTTHYEKTGYNRIKPFKLERQEFIDWYNKQDRVCVYCEIKESDLGLITDGHNSSQLLTIDCKYNEKGYQVDNIVLACHRCNYLKSNVFDFDEMRIIGELFIKPKWKKNKENL